MIEFGQSDRLRPRAGSPRRAASVRPTSHHTAPASTIAAEREARARASPISARTPSRTSSMFSPTTTYRGPPSTSNRRINTRYTSSSSGRSDRVRRLLATGGEVRQRAERRRRCRSRTAPAVGIEHLREAVLAIRVGDRCGGVDQHRRLDLIGTLFERPVEVVTQLGLDATTTTITAATAKHDEADHRRDRGDPRQRIDRRLTTLARRRRSGSRRRAPSRSSDGRTARRSPAGAA